METYAIIRVKKLRIIMKNNQIKPIDSHKKTALYETRTGMFNPNTGEIETLNEIRVVKEKNITDFIQLYTDNSYFLASKNMNNLERQCLLALFPQMTYFNIISINSYTRKNIEKITSLSKGSISKAVNGLIEKKILIKANENDLEKFVMNFTGTEYFFNPNVVGKGSFKDLKNLRQTIVQEFNFDTFEMQEKIITETDYGVNEVVNNIDKHEVKSITHSDVNGKKSTEILIGEKDYIDTDVNQNEQINEVKSIENQISQEPSLFDENIEKTENIPPSIDDDWIALQREKLEKENREKEEAQYKNSNIRALRLHLAKIEVDIIEFEKNNKAIDPKDYSLQMAKFRLQKEEIKYKISLEINKK